MEKLLKNTAIITVLTFCSRVLGVIRDACIAMIFGTSSLSDAFFIAFRPFDLVRKMLSEGILGISFVPVFTTELETRGKTKAFEIVFSFFCFLSFAAVLAMFAGLVCGPVLLKFIAPGFAPGSYEYGLTLVLLKLMLPYLWFVMILALCMGVLNSFGQFAMPAAAPVIFNVSVITFTICISSLFDIPVYALALGVIVGGLCQLGIQVPALIKVNCFKRLAFKVFHPKAWQIIKTMVPCVIGAASYQINIMVASFFASTLERGSVSFVYYADRLVQFPLALFGISAATVFLPELAKQAAGNRMDQVGQIFSSGVKLVLYITIPAMTGLMILNDHIVALLFGRGMFGAQAVSQTADCLFFLVSGLWAFTGVRLFVTLHFSIQSVIIPFISGVLSIGLNLLLCSVLVDLYGLSGLMAGVSGSAVVAFVFLCFFVPGQVRLDKTGILLSACRSVFLSAIMLFLVKLVLQWTGTWQATPFMSAGRTIFCIGAGMAVYLAGSLVLKSPELGLLSKGLKKNRK